VGDEHVGARDEGTSETYALLLTTRELVGPLLGVTPEPHEVEHLGHRRVAFAGIGSADAQRHLHVLRGREHGDEPERLKDVADSPPAQLGASAVAEGGEVDAADSDGARCGLVESAEQVEKSRLATTALPADDEQLARVHGE